MSEEEEINEVINKNSEIKEIDKSLNKVCKSICKIIFKNRFATGFLIKLFIKEKRIILLNYKSTCDRKGNGRVK